MPRLSFQGPGGLTLAVAGAVVGVFICGWAALAAVPARRGPGHARAGGSFQEVENSVIAGAMVRAVRLSGKWGAIQVVAKPSSPSQQRASIK